MGNQEKAAKGDTVLATSTRLFQGRVVEDSLEKRGESLLASTPLLFYQLSWEGLQHLLNIKQR